MFINFSETSQSVFDVDVCIIGAGAAGFASAISLLNSGLKVFVVEGGVNTQNAKAIDLQQGIVKGQPHTGIHDARERIVGGTTTKWGGQALPFMPEDFEKRDHVDLSGWPISLQDLNPYYRKAESVLGTDATVEFDNNPWDECEIKQPPFTNDSISLFVTKWCKVPNFATQHGQTLINAANITLLSNANVVELVPTSSLDEVKSLRISTLDGKEGSINAKYIIAAGGALETVRLFLSSSQFGQEGLGNTNGLVGLYFQDHAAAIVGQVIPKDRLQFHDLFDPFYKRGFKYFPRVRLSPLFAKKAKVLHASAQIVFCDDENSVLGVAKQAFAQLKNKKLPGLTVLKSIMSPSKISDLIRATHRWKVKKRGSSSMSGAVWLEIHSEQDPIKESSISLADDRDALGMRRICLNWRVSELTIATIRRTAKLVKEEFALSGVGEVLLEPWIENDSDPRIWVSDVFHQAGGLRMGNTPKDGVVDLNCKVFGVKNLYVASSAVFPTSSFSNPTMTTIALAIRISEQVEKLSKEIIN